ncbi:hypothetical protein NEPAR06_2143 [Nematocida parisii]|uniref:Uncharacterized protein n=1 Tax=Nematocida parisii (strain ERTm3) TaxID=935791 RepID=I3EF69_NEMP3|nr:uncharacterized protein NEPG_02044 [Nematocida parisii ERTm1]EIJ87866.1 hypothetical protein NEQG_01938 [Nematocida parisii ERTm3]KAI5146100.1 hypothetical protein NEPAR07_2110 [Nematocida parisii]EIJ93088.1 hypothetical protein NEPG_02044 [Nematocida parisii ERTm1]KAI5156246.1 hypothetical protein NEPAR06_2143 [Nematocida parisii]KAI5158707.1 hypothetical protein NEPAR05_2233 [Nematocida parisii]|eukprot:XP_013059871.1 hypothetical protein NEPG_02044 [Nematocida parisii ERTm1]
MLDKSIKKLKPISDILVYLSVKRADSALIKFIIAYRQMKNIYNNSHYIGELIEENMSKQEKIHLLQCLTKNGLANQVTSIVNKIKDTKEIKKSNDGITMCLACMDYYTLYITQLMLIICPYKQELIAR